MHDELITDVESLSEEPQSIDGDRDYDDGIRMSQPCPDCGAHIESTEVGQHCGEYCGWNTYRQ